MLIDFYNMKLKGLVALKFDNCHLVWRMKLFLRGWKKKMKCTKQGGFIATVNSYPKKFKNEY